MAKQYIHIFKNLRTLMELKKLHETGKYNQCELADYFGCSRACIQRNLKKLETL
ncbi:HTH domain-containing protein [Pseudoalteromonas sp. JC3]|nr:HTH domain-containing protein [Pseudoalteromonas sp. JC3]